MHDLDSALQKLRARDDTVAEYAHGLWRVMRGAAAHPTKITQYDVQQIVWGTLATASRRPDAPVLFRNARASCAAFADLLELLGYDRYATVCRSEITTSILDSTDDPDLCAELIGKAWRSSGVQPPDTPIMTWSPLGGPIEVSLHAAAGRLLEEAIVAGHIPQDGLDASGDPDRVAITVRMLSSPDDKGADTWFARLLEERLDRWTIGFGSQTRRELLVRLRPEIKNTPDVGDVDLPAVQRLVEACADGGVRLTKAGYLPTSLVGELVDLIPMCADIGGTGRSESQWPPVMALRDLAFDLDLIDATHDRLILTEKGKEALATDTLLMRVGEGVVSLDHPVLGVIQEAVLAALLLEDSVERERIFEKATHVVTEDGWTGEDGLPLGRQHAEEATLWFLRRLRVLDVVETDWEYDHVALTEAGRSVARWGLRGRLLYRGAAG